MIRALLIFSFALSLQLTPASSRAADFVGTVSQALHQTLTGQRCPDATETELSLVRCPKSNDWFRSLDQTIETGFFSRGAAVQLERDRCGVSKTQNMINAPAALRNAIADDVNAKLPRLRALYRQIQDEKKDLESLRPLMQKETGGAMIPEANSDLFFRRSKEISDRLEKIGPLYAALVKSTSLGNFDEGQRLLRKLIDGQGVVSGDQVRQAYVKENDHLTHDVTKLETMRTSPTQFKVGRGDREELFKHGQPETWIDASAPSAQGLMCRLDARYGSGVKDLTATVVIGGSVISLAAGPLVELGVSAELAVAAMTGRAALLADTAQMVAVGGRIFGGLATLQQVQSSCPMIRANARCDADPNSEISALSERNCALTLALATGAQTAQIAMSPFVRAQFAKAMTLAKTEMRSARTGVKTSLLPKAVGPASRIPPLPRAQISFAQLEAESPEMADTVNDAREFALSRKFGKPSKQEMEIVASAYRDVKNPDYRRTLEAVHAKLLDQKKWAAYFERLMIDASDEMRATGNPKWIKEFEQGKMERWAVLKVLAKRAHARGETVQPGIASINLKDDSEFFEAIGRGPFIDNAQNGAKHGKDTHFIQMDFVADTIESEIQGRSREFYQFLAKEKSGQNAWSWTYDHYVSDPTSPEYLNDEFMPPQIPRR